MSFTLSTSGAMKRIDAYNGAQKSPPDFPVKIFCYLPRPESLCNYFPNIVLVGRLSVIALWQVSFLCFLQNSTCWSLLVQISSLFQNWAVKMQFPHPSNCSSVLWMSMQTLNRIFQWKAMACTIYHLHLMSLAEVDEILTSEIPSSLFLLHGV